MKRLFAFFLGLLLFFYPVAVQADTNDSSPQEIVTTEEVRIVEEIVEVPESKAMTKEEIDELLGEDPYLGQTSWLGSKVEKSK